MGDREPLDVKYLTAATARVIVAAVEDDTDELARLMVEVGDDCGPHGLFALCCGLAESVIVMGKFERVENGWWGFEVINTSTGEVVDPVSVGKDNQPVISGQRFVIAHLNGDLDHCLALFTGDPVGVCTGLTVLVAAHGRHARAENSG